MPRLLRSLAIPFGLIAGFCAILPWLPHPGTIVPLAVAIAATAFAAHSEKRRREIEKLHRVVDAVVECRGPDFAIARLAERLVEIFEADGAAIYDRHTGLIARSGNPIHALSDEALWEMAYCGRTTTENPKFSLAPIECGGEFAGSLAISGRIPARLLNEIAARIGLGLAAFYAAARNPEGVPPHTSEEIKPEELKSALLDAMAHEIRNPLHSIKLAVTALLSGRSAGQPYEQEMLTIIREESDRMDRSIEETIRLTRAEEAGLRLNKQPQNMARLIPAAVAEMGALAARRPIRLRVPESLPPAECDKGLMTRVLKQLLGNALKYSPDGSPLTVSARFTGDEIVIGVEDRGPGVAQDERDHIFERYYRGRAARRGVSGAGLGLASARSIVQAHGGRIWVTSPPLGGAAFHVALPAAGGERTAALQ